MDLSSRREDVTGSHEGDTDKFDDDDGRGERGEPGGAVGGARVFREKEKHGSSARVSRRNRWLNRAVKQLASGARGVGKGGRERELHRGGSRGKG